MKTVFYKSKQWLKKALYCLFDVLQEFQRENSELKTRNTEVRGVFFLITGRYLYIVYSLLLMNRSKKTKWRSELTSEHVNC